MRRGCLWVVVLIAVLAVFTGCSENKSGGAGTIKIGVAADAAGEAAAYGEAGLEGIRLACKLYPEVLDKKVELVMLENKTDKEAGSVAKRIEKDKMAAVIGGYGGALSEEIGTAARQAGIPLLFPSCFNSGVMRDNESLFRTSFVDYYEGMVMAQYAFYRLGAKKTAIIYDSSDDYATKLVKAYTDAFGKLTGNAGGIPVASGYKTGESDFSLQVDAVKAKSPDAIYIAGSRRDSLSIIALLKKQGNKAAILGSDSLDTHEGLSAVKKELEGVLFPSHFSTEKPVTKESEKFLKEFRMQYNKEPETASALFYDAYLLLLNAIRESGSAKGEGIKNALQRTTDFEGVTGKITVDENRNAIKHMPIKTIKEGRMLLLENIAPKK